MKRSLGAKTFACPSPVWVIATYDQQGRANAMTASWAGICCSDPPALAVSLRKATHTYQSLVQRKAFTVNIPGGHQARQADYLGIASGRDTDKFARAGLTPIKAHKVDAPLVEEFPIVLECSLINTLELGLHTMFIGQILEVQAEESVLGEDGKPVMELISPILFSAPERVYYASGKVLGQAFQIGRTLEDNGA